MLSSRMEYSLFDTLTLTTIPLDIIRRIIASDFGSEKNSLRFISPKWNSLVTEYLKALPPIEWIYFESRPEAGDVVAHFQAPIKHLFRYPLPSPCQFRGNTETSITFDFYFPWTDPNWSSTNNYVARIVKCTTLIEHLHVCNFSKENVEFLYKWMPGVKIGKITVWARGCDLEFRKRLMQFIKHYQIAEISISIVHKDNDTQTLKMLLRSVPKCTTHITIDLMPRMVSEESRRTLIPLIENIINKKNKTMIVLNCGSDKKFSFGNPFFVFMNNFCHLEPSDFCGY